MKTEIMILLLWSRNPTLKWGMSSRGNRGGGVSASMPDINAQVWANTITYYKGGISSVNSQF